MNTKPENPGPPQPDTYRALQILGELSNNDALTQRDLSKRLGIALGLVNSYVRNLIKKGYITVKTIPPKRYAYYLTPRGFSEKTRLTYDLLADYTRIYREARGNLQKLFLDLQSAGMKRIVFAGTDEVAEIAYLTLQETSMELSGVVDDDKPNGSFFGRPIRPIRDVGRIPHDRILVTSYLKRETLYQQLLAQGVDGKAVSLIFSRQGERLR